MTQLIFGRKHKSRSSCSVTLLSHLPQHPILNILNLCYSRNVTDQVSYPYYNSRQTYSTVYCNLYLQSDSYRTPEMFLPVILVQMIGSRRNLLQKHCLFMLVLCMNNLLWPQQMVLGGMHHCSTELQLPWLPDLTCPGINLTPQTLWKTTSDWRLPTLRIVFVANGSQQLSSSDVSNRGWWSFEHLMSSHSVHHEFMYASR